MRRTVMMAIIITMMLLLPTSGADAKAMVDDPPRDERQPGEGEGNGTLKLWSNGQNKCWSHFGTDDDESVHNDEEDPYYEDAVESGELEIDLWCKMEPLMNQRLSIDTEGKFTGEIRVAVAGHWTNGQDGCSGSNNGNCENLNISLYRGSSEIHREEYEIPDENNADGQEYTARFDIPTEKWEDDFLVWDKEEHNPQVRIQMTIMGDYEESFIVLAGGQEALFRLYLGNNSTVDFPIHADTWSSGFQAGEDSSGSGDEDAPGFGSVLVAASVSMAAIVYSKKKEDEENQS